MKMKLLLAAICVTLCGVIMPGASASAQELEEQTAYVTDAGFRDVEKQTISTGITPYTTRVPINWTVPKKTMYTTNYFKKSKGSSITVSLTLSASAKVGVLRTDGKLVYVTGKSVYHTFELEEDSYYAVVVQNDNDSSITASGNYYK
ncbi:MAG: hypothetical protein NC300_06715 [Bacteroidales bacterium]|nr:hypothetical protein [Clostridium sp.]MCM1203819.1 hypothetical protein [Bacteroidales bacterium]